MGTESCLSSSQINKVDNEKLVRPKAQLKSLLEDAGADKDVFTMKEVMFYLGKYIMSKELYDKQQQHIVHCGEDALGAVLGVKSFSVKEPRAPADTESDSRSSTSQQQRRRRRSSDPESTSAEDEPRERRKRHKSDSFSLTFDDSLSWCVIGGLHRERGNSESSDAQSNSDVGISHSEGSDESADSDSDSDNFSVEFEVESINSDAYSENDEDSLPGENEVYEVTIFAEEEDSFDEDTEITEADYWKCAECNKLNPPLPRHCKSCWKVRPGWLPETHSNRENSSTNTQPITEDARITTTPRSASDDKLLPSKPSSPLPETDEGVDPSTSSGGGSSQEETPELERYNSLEACLPATCLEPCVICQSRPKNGCIVHGRTGHLMACYTCAKKLKNRNKLCPVCREPIQSVVLTYMS
uniref:E3 ubiquitin-protein ligase Mdm2 n=2 Tax=Cyprinus carpio TaxID=7962 RepID=A0A9R1SLZ9_CYPCA